MTASKIAIIGSGPTGIYTLKGLAAAAQPLSITVFESESDAGKGTPYHPHINDRAMLANIASFELPSICETLVQWLNRQPDADLERLNVPRGTITDRDFYPRVVLGEYLGSQFRQLIEKCAENGHAVTVKANHRVIDIKLQTDDILLTTKLQDGETKEYSFDHVVMATGHNWPDTTEVKPGYFVSPWPAPALKTIGASSVGILGTSLSAIDALITVATAHGAFYLDASGVLQYFVSETSDRFQATLMSRKGLLPEADFYFEYPFTPLQFCTNDAVDALIERKSANFLDELFELFKRELTTCDPEYSAGIGLPLLTLDTFAPAYFRARAESDPFVWAASNLAEAEQNKINHFTIPWRDAILRMHEVIGRAVRHFDESDLRRFHQHFKAVFVDDYATVPHQSIQRLLALRRAGRLSVIALGKDHKIHTDGLVRGAVVQYEDKSRTFDAFIDATGQSSMSARDIPFPSLIKQGAIKRAATRKASNIVTENEEETFVRTGGLDLDSNFRPICADNLCSNLYCVAISFLMHKMPFVQGITSAQELGEIVSRAIREAIEGTGTSVLSVKAIQLGDVTHL